MKPSACLEVRIAIISVATIKRPVDKVQSVAQAESEARSQNIKWGLQKKIENGTCKLYFRKCYGYIQNEKGDLIIDPNQAAIVRNIFDWYLNGYSILAIIRRLHEQSVKSPTGKDCWSKRTIDTMLSNEKYIGNSILGKTLTGDFPRNRRRINRAEKEMFMLTGVHPSIISEVQFECVQNEKVRRSNISRNEGGFTTRKATHYSMKNQKVKNNEDSPK